MIVTAIYTPPPEQPKPQGKLTLELDTATAYKLLALVGQCNGCVFDKLHAAMGLALPRTGRLRLKSRHTPHNTPAINFYTDYEFKPY